MPGSDTLLKPSECAILLVDLQAGLGYGVESMPRQALLNNALALAKTATAFGVPVIATTSASKVYSGPLFPQIQSALPEIKTIERRSMNAWEDDAARGAVQATGRKRLLAAGLLTAAIHELALRRLEQAGAQLTSWIQVLLEFQRDWTRHETYEAARAIVVENGGGYGMGLAYAREMIHPG